MKRILFTGSVIVFAMYFAMITGCSSNKTNQSDSTQTLKGVISISGAFAMYPIVVKWAEEFKKLHPDVKIDVSAGGAGKGMTDALSGMVDLGMVSRPISPEEVNKGAWFIALTKDAVLPTININNPVSKELMQQGLTKKQLADVFLTEKKITWGQLLKTNSTAKVVAYTRSDACGAAEMWGKYLGKNQESLTGIGVFGDPGIADAVKSDKNALGFNNVIYVYDIKTRKPFLGMTVLPIDINENGKIDPEENFYSSLDNVMSAISTGRYPSPPARDLYFVSKGSPKKYLVTAFIQWILTDGQKYIPEAGYVGLPSEQIKTQLEKLNKK
ncbi:MAG: extracellular solute-binding protein [Bacteroidota bacterium]